MKNWKESETYQETLKAGDETIEKELATIYNKCITGRRIRKTWKEANKVACLSRKATEMHRIQRTNLLAIQYLQSVHENHTN